MKKTFGYAACALLTMILTVCVSWLVFRPQTPEYYGVKKVVLTRMSMQDGEKEKTVTDPKDIAEIVNVIRGMEIFDTPAELSYGVPGYGFEFHMTDGTTWSCGHTPGEGGKGPYYDSEGHELMVRMASAKPWRIMDYEEVSLNP